MERAATTFSHSRPDIPRQTSVFAIPHGIDANGNGCFTAKRKNQV